MLREQNNIKIFDGNVTTELDAAGDESFLIKNILVYNPVSDWLTVKIDRTTVGYWRIGTELGSHLAWTSGAMKHAHSITTSSSAGADESDFYGLENAAGTEIASQMLGNLAADTEYLRAMNFNNPYGPMHRTLMSYLGELGIFSGYPVPADSKFVLSGAAQAGSYIIVVYDWYDSEDMSHEMPNGKNGDSLVWVNYGNSGGNINTDGYTELDTTENPAEFDDFPFGQRAPTGKTTLIHGILASDFAPAECDGTDGTGTQYLRLTDERTVLFDDDENGFPLYAKDYGSALVGDFIAEGLSVIGNLSDEDARPPLIFPEPLTFVGDERLLVELGTVQEGSGKNISADEQTVAFIIETGGAAV